MAINLLEKLRELLTVADEGDEAAIEDTIDDSADSDNPGDSETISNESEDAEDDAENETLPDSEVAIAELRDALNVLAVENEMLRTRIAELGGDSEVESDEIETDIEDDVEDDENDEKAQADIDQQANEIAALRGES